MRVKTLLSLFCFILLSSCTNYLERQSEPVQRGVYATKDAIDVARVDLASQYINEVTRLIDPPKDRIEVKGVERSSAVVGQQKRVITVPASYTGLEVCVVGSAEYQELLKSKETAIQFETENEQLKALKTQTEKELQDQTEYTNKILAKLHILEVETAEKSTTILKLRVILFGIAAAAVIYAVVKMHLI